jgi:dTDP-4-dehydrorhamnose 3,5-epimerase
VNVVETELPGVVVLEPAVHGDERGFFMEAWNRRRYEGIGIPAGFVQDNLSYSAKGVLRGLHFQHPNAQGKLVSVLRGEVFDVAVDVRLGSPSFGEWVGVTLSAENKRQLYVPEGFAHGFVVTGEAALFSYKCTAYYSPETEHSLLWSDPDLGIGWPVEAPELSAKDASAPALAQIAAGKLPRYAEAHPEKPGRAGRA